MTSEYPPPPLAETLKQRKWDARMLRLARFIATDGGGWSKDPSTRVGAVVTDSLNRLRGQGFNGFARGVRDTPGRLEDRNVKLALTIHAEINALNNASETEGCSLYVWPLPVCAACMAQIIQRGIRRVIVLPEHLMPREKRGRWATSASLARHILEDPDVYVELIELDPDSI